MFFKVLLSSYEWLVCYLLKKSSDKYNEELKSSGDPFTAKCNSQVYFCRSLSLAYVEVC